MQLQDEHTTYIRNAFNTMKTKEDFLALLNYAKALVYGEKAIPFTQTQINYNSNAKANKKRYIQFSIKKKMGGERIIHAPSRGLKAIQKCLNLVLQTIYEPGPAATGFVPGKSIVDNAKIHAGSLYVYNIDLKDFFPSIEAGRIWNRLQHPPFSLSEKTGRKELANTITWLCCHEMEVERLDENKQWQKVIGNVLPQGAPTSPTLTNIICQQLDYYFLAVAKSFGLRYSRYADDITFSSMHNVYQYDSVVKNKKGQTFLAELQRIVAEQKFHIKDSKTRLQKEGHTQMVTGLVVNEKANVPKRYIKQLRVWLYYWEKYGYERASSYFLPEYLDDKGHVKKGKPDMANVIAGKLEYLKMVKGLECEMYLKLRGRFDYLVEKSSSTFNRKTHLNKVLDILLNNGLSDAMKLYKPISK